MPCTGLVPLPAQARLTRCCCRDACRLERLPSCQRRSWRYLAWGKVRAELSRLGSGGSELSQPHQVEGCGFPVLVRSPEEWAGDGLDPEDRDRLVLLKTSILSR